MPWWAPKWRQLGAELGVGDHLMDIIEHDHPNDCETCCRKMLDEWLDCSSSWDDVIVAVDTLFINGMSNILYKCMVEIHGSMKHASTPL